VSPDDQGANPRADTGDVTRVVFAIDDRHFAPDRWPIGRHGLLETVVLPLQPNEQRVLR